MSYINKEIINMVDKAFPENAHLGRFVRDDKIIYGFDRVSSASLSNLVEILVFDVKNFTFTFNEDAFFQQTPDSIIPQLLGRFDSESISKIISEFLLRRNEFQVLKEKCQSITGQDLFDAIDQLKPMLQEVYKNDPFNPSILEKQVEEMRSSVEKLKSFSQEQHPLVEQESQQQEEQEDLKEQAPEVDWLNGYIDIMSAITLFLLYFSVSFSKGTTFFLVSLQLMLTARCFIFIVNLLKWFKFKFKNHAK